MPSLLLKQFNQTLANYTGASLEQRFQHLITLCDFYAITQFYLQLEQVQRKALLEIVAKNSHQSAFIEYLDNHSGHYLSYFFLAVIHTQKAKIASSENRHQANVDESVGYIVYNAQSAYELYNKALEISQQDILVYASMLENLQYINEEIHTIEEYYSQGLHCDKNSFYLHQAMSHVLHKKSYRGRQDAFLLAQDLTKKSIMGSPNHQLIAQAHIQEWLFLGTQQSKQLQQNYFANESIQDEINEAYSLFSAARLPNPCSLKASQVFMFCFYMSNDIAQLTNELNFNHGYIDFSTAPWCYLGVSQLRYSLILRQCGIQENIHHCLSTKKIINN